MKQLSGFTTKRTSQNVVKSLVKRMRQAELNETRNG